MQDVKDEEARQNRAEELRKQRSAEAKSLIGQRSTEARAVFERNSSMGQMNFRKPSLPASNQVVTPAPTPKETVVEKPQSKPVEAKEPVVVDQQKEINANEVSTEDNIVPPPAIFGNDDNRVEVQPDVKSDITTDIQGGWGRICPNPGSDKDHVLYRVQSMFFTGCCLASSTSNGKT